MRRERRRTRERSNTGGVPYLIHPAVVEEEDGAGHDGQGAGRNPHCHLLPEKKDTLEGRPNQDGLHHHLVPRESNQVHAQKAQVAAHRVAENADHRKPEQGGQRPGTYSFSQRVEPQGENRGKNIQHQGRDGGAQAVQGHPVQHLGNRYEYRGGEGQQVGVKGFEQ